MSPRESGYEFVVIGSGLGGLSAGALLAKAGRSVLVVEQAEAAGGYAHAFKRGPYTFDTAVHIFAQGQPDKLPVALFDYLGVGEMVDFLPLPSYYKAVYDDLTFEMPFGLEEFIAAHTELFPHEREPIDKFFRLSDQVAKEAHGLPPRLGLANLDAAAKQFPTLFRYLRSTLQEVLDEMLDDPRAKAVCATQWPYPGTPPSRLSFVTFATALTVTLEGGFYCRGGFQSLVDALVTAIERHGGEVVVNARATRIGVEDGAVTGVELENGTFVKAPTVISNADARRTFEEMLGEDQVPEGFMKRLRRMKPSLSAFVLFIATEMDLAQLGATHELFRVRHWDHEQVYADIQDGRPGGTWANCPTLADPSLAPDGEHLLILTSLARYDIGRPWAGEVERFTDELIGDFELAYPGLREGIKFREVATPRTLERYCLNQGGAAYGWENTPHQTGGKRAPHQTPLDGLLLSGHWTQPGTSSLRALVSGLHTAQIALLSRGLPTSDFEHPDFPPMG